MISIMKKELRMLNIWSHKISKLPIVLVLKKYAEIQQRINFIMGKQGRELTLQNGPKVLSCKVPSMELQHMLLILFYIESFPSPWRLSKNGPNSEIQLTSNGNSSSSKQYSSHIP
jgi:hypothetical protein